MSFSLVRSRTLNGISAPEVAVETHLANGLPSFTIVGLAETAIKESRDRVRAAIINSNFTFPARKITVNLAPADLPKEGARFDLPIAISILMASEQIQIDKQDLLDFEFIGELSLDGRLRSVAGILPVAFAVSTTGRCLALPLASQQEAAFINNLALIRAVNLSCLIDDLTNRQIFQSDLIRTKSICKNIYPDFKDVKGQYLAKRAVEIAAAGRHNLLMVGPPGCGKTMLATRLPGVLPELSEQAAIESASIQSISSQGFQKENWRRTPFRSPHHSCSPVALIGGGSRPIPGEVSLAHGGVLFLDEIPEFDRRALEMLREPLETGYVNIARINHSQRYLADIMLVAAANPCHCGYHGSLNKRCRCSAAMIERYQNKLSGPLIDRFDMHIELAALKPSELTEIEYGESSRSISRRVNLARQTQIKRQYKLNYCLQSNELDNALCHSSALRTYMDRIIGKLKLTARSYHRVLRLSRTIADLDESEKIQKKHINEALQYRVFDRN